MPRTNRSLEAFKENFEILGRGAVETPGEQGKAR
jgi:hypothetical protein